MAILGCTSIGCVAQSGQQRTLLALSKNDHTLAIINSVTLKVIARVPVGPDPHGPAQPITPTTPHVHDITIQDLVATGATGQSYIRGLPESCIRNVTLDGVKIQTNNFGIALLHMTGTFINVTSTPVPPNPPFDVEENVTVTTGGTTPAIPPTPPLAGQVPCS